MRFFRRNIKVRGFYQNTFQKSITIYTRRLKNGLRRWRLRCLPFFYLIGINRGGSTALWTSLASHPQLMSSKAGKEHHYWNEIRYAGMSIVRRTSHLFQISSSITINLVELKFLNIIILTR